MTGFSHGLLCAPLYRAVATGTPRTKIERLKRAFRAWLAGRDLPDIPYRKWRRRRRVERNRVRLERILWGKRPFVKPPRPPRDRERQYTTEIPGLRKKYPEGTYAGHFPMMFIPTGWSGTPRTWREAWDRAGRAMEILNDFNAEGWQGLGFWFAHKNDASLPESAVDAFNFRHDLVERNAARMKRIYCGLKPFQKPAGDKATRYAVLCKIACIDRV